MDALINVSLLALFIPTFFFVSITPGMCMTLAMTMGMTIGIRRTFWMMWGELIGVGVVSVAAVVGVAAVMLQYPTLFTFFKYLGGAYLFYLGIQMWRSKGRMALTTESQQTFVERGLDLALQGFVTAIANPKGWAFMISLLPPFINPNQPVAPQLTVLLLIILSTEFLCLVLYASGGLTLRKFLEKGGNLRLINRIAGSLMMGVGIWLATG